MRYIVTPLHRFLFPTVLWQTTDTGVHLTFDDGPHPSATNKALAILERYGVQGTFFLLGKEVGAHASLAREILAAGHEIGNHSFTHRNLMFCSKKTIHAEISQASEAIKLATGKEPALFRPPYGYFDYRTVHAAANQGKKTVMWTLDVGDFRSRSPQSTVDATARRLQHGSILLLHDNPLTACRIHELLPRLLDAILERGFKVTPLLV